MAWPKSLGPLHVSTFICTSSLASPLAATPVLPLAAEPEQVQLGLLKTKLQVMMEAGGGDLSKLADQANELVPALETAFLETNVLQPYMLNPDKDVSNPAFSEEDAEYARGGIFENL